MFGIKIEKEKMELNKGKRTLAKLCLNNLWGRFSLRNFGLTQCVITGDVSEFCNYLNDDKIEVTSIDELTDQVILIGYIKKRDFIQEHQSSNVIISLWTTSAARIHLLHSMQKVVRTDGCQLLYTDTDSLIFVHPENNCPLELGPHLGQFTDEFPNHNILEYCSGGAKQYGLKIQKKGQNDIEYILKVRGITLNHDVIQNQNLCYETFKEQVLKFAKTNDDLPVQIVYPNFLRPSIRFGSVTSFPLKKYTNLFVGKGIVRPSDFKVLDFGFIDNKHPLLGDKLVTFCDSSSTNSKTSIG
ncbi:DNA_pol_B_2 domain-containing protein [Meloidogyne graminicola]|uniref:DNA_pol_B_2 domain-containing protein n=1 Tax=Meloidogyne graminicola TaxID=189291 RepID=A0A8S9ZS30_9BILA|nr:DNA_pol_B_2 domain-containing protein [Meloidogyne graminicola]